MSADKLVRDFIVSTTYRKHEQSGLKFKTLRELSHENALPSIADQAAPRITQTFESTNAYMKARHGFVIRQASAVPVARARRMAGVGLADFITGAAAPDRVSPDAILASILAYTATPMRWEPLNSSREHRGVASPGSLFITELRVIVRTENPGEAIALHYHGHEECLEVLGPASPELLQGAEFGLFIVARMRVCAELYGEFSSCLACLEGGALAAQATFVCEALGAVTRARLVENDETLRTALSLEHWSDLVIAQILVDGQTAAVRIRTEDIIHRPICVAILESTHIEPLARLRQLVECYRDLPNHTVPSPLGRSQRCTTKVNDPRHSSNGDVFDVMRRRTSGYVETAAPIAPLFTGDEVLEFLHDVVALVSRVRDACLLGVDILLRASVAYGDASTNGGYEANITTGEVRRIVDDLLWTRSSIAGRNRSLVLTFGVDDVAELRKWGPAAFWASHIGAGALSQAVSVAAAARHMCARPIRAYADHMVDLGLPLDRRAIFQVICCSDRRANPAYPMAFSA